MNKHKFLITLVCLLVVYACRPDKTLEQDTTQEWGKEHSVDFNQEVNEREQLEIAAFLRHHHYLKMDTTASGLRYMIYKKSTENKVKTGDEVLVQIKIERLDGAICYQTDSISGSEIIKIGKSEVESGIQEGLKLMRIGEQAKLILPSYLAHGLLGDRYTVPPQAILYVDIKLLNKK
jgi:FKBP-type peptidyl-prolyl cis-trans isomerase